MRLLKSHDRDLRKAAFDPMYDTFGSFKNTFAATLSGNIKKDNFYAKVRNYRSARHAALFRNNIDESVYDQLIEAIQERLPILHRYTDLRQEILNYTSLFIYV